MRKKYFKIRNLTNMLEKRDINANKILEISYMDNMLKKVKKISPNDVLFLELSKLPLSVHKMRINGLVSVSEINKDEFFLNENNEKMKLNKPKINKNKSVTNTTKEKKSVTTKEKKTNKYNRKGSETNQKKVIDNEFNLDGDFMKKSED